MAVNLTTRSWAAAANGQGQSKWKPAWSLSSPVQLQDKAGSLKLQALSQLGDQEELLATYL